MQKEKVVLVPPLRGDIARLCCMIVVFSGHSHLFSVAFLTGFNHVECTKYETCAICITHISNGREYFWLVYIWISKTFPCLDILSNTCYSTQRYDMLDLISLTKCHMHGHYVMLFLCHSDVMLKSNISSQRFKESLTDYFNIRLSNVHKMNKYMMV